MTKIDWKELKRSIGLRNESASDDDARRAVCKLVGDDAIDQMVDTAIFHDEGRALAWMLLVFLRPKHAFPRLRRVFETASDEATQCDSIGLLARVAPRSPELIPILEMCRVSPSVGVRSEGIHAVGRAFAQTSPDRRGRYQDHRTALKGLLDLDWGDSEPVHSALRNARTTVEWTENALREMANQ